jgi:predicted outer membrane protein
MFALVLTLVAIGSQAGVAAATTYPGAEPTEVDQDWVQEALRIDLFEIKGGEIAQHQAKSPAVAKLGEMLAEEHKAAFAEERAVAKEVDVPVPGEPTPAMKRELRKLGGIHGKAFDKAYPEAEIEAHLEAIETAETEIAHGSSATVVDSATMNLRMYEAHLEAAREVLKGV